MSEPRIIRHGIVNLDDHDASLSAKDIALRGIGQVGDDATPGQMIQAMMATIEEIREHASVGRLIKAEAKIARSGEPEISHEELVRRFAEKDAQKA
ncbi:MAG: hypothetical protein ACR2GR_04015, partial [Rhodothermales bacterium]